MPNPPFFFFSQEKWKSVFIRSILPLTNAGQWFEYLFFKYFASATKSVCGLHLLGPPATVFNLLCRRIYRVSCAAGHDLLSAEEESHGPRGV